MANIIENVFKREGRTMITSLGIDNFKSLHNFQMDFSEFTVIVGNNASGKSSVLQAISFLVKSADEDFDTILEQRGLQIEDLKSKFVKNSNCIRFICGLRLNIDNRSRELRWEMEISALTKKKTMELASEKIWDAESNFVLLEYTSGDQLTICTNEGDIRTYPRLILKSSALKVVVDVEKEKNLPELVAIKRFLLNSSSYELLSPSDMRQSSRGTARTIGMSGRNLPSFIKTMSEEQRVSFMDKIHRILGYGQIEGVETHTKGKPGWTYIETTEKYDNISVRMTSKDMSDGMLRLLAFVAISEVPEAESVMLLDEIENGININYAEELLKVLQEIYKTKKHQLVVTTHSTVFVDYVEANDIVFLYRERDSGLTKAIKLFEISDMRERLEYMYPGEVLLNITNEDIIEKLLMRGALDE